MSKKEQVTDDTVDPHSESRIEVAAQAYIRSSLFTIIERLLLDLETEQEQTRFIDFAQHVYTLYSMRFARRTENLRSCFDRFCAETNPTFEEHFGADPKTQPPNAIRADEDFFLEILHGTLTEGNFELLSDNYYQCASATDFEVALEMTMDTNDLDSSFIKRLHSRHKDDSAFRKAAGVTQNVLIYNRGMGQASTKGLFILEKIDIILEWTFFAFMTAVWGLAARFLSILNVLSHIKKAKAMFGGKSGSTSTPDGGDSPIHQEDDDFVPENDDDTFVGTKRFVYRHTLKQALRENILNLFMPVELLEPTFRELIIVYRSKKDLEKGEAAGRIPRIVLKSFTDIPIADFEVVLPAQKPVARPMDALKIIIAIAGAAFTVHNQLLESRERLSSQETVTIGDILLDLWPTLAFVGGYVLKIGMQYMAAQKKYNSIITSYLYQKSLCSNRGLLPFIVDSTLQQEVKESIIGYYFLWTNRAQTFAELDEECEIFLGSLEEEVDFEADDSIRKLMKDDLVRCAPPPRTRDSQLFHLSISRGTLALQTKISNFHEDKNRECPYCSYLHSSEGNHQ